MEPSISAAKIQASVSALLKWKSLQSTKANPQTPQQTDEYIYLLLTLKNTPPKTLQSTPHKIPLPHSLHPSPNICLILKDSPKNPKHKININDIQTKIKSENIPISKVIKLAKLRSICNTFDSRKELCASYDVFLADERIVHFLPSVLGKLFYRKKVPVPVSLKGGLRWKEMVEEACASEVLCFGSGSCNSVRVGRRGVMDGREIVENVKVGVERVVELVPKNWKGVAAIHLKFSDSLAMPIYQKDGENVVSGLRLDEGEMKRKD